MSEDYYDVAQICLNGHVINDSVNTYPDQNKNFCPQCGKATITKCSNCETEIQGYYHVSGVVGYHGYTVPAYCHNCGEPFPWTRTRAEEAKKYANELKELSNEDRATVVASIDPIITDGPSTGIASSRFKKIINTAGPIVWENFRMLLVDIASETAKKIIWPS